jgi:hypothetical protein
MMRAMSYSSRRTRLRYWPDHAALSAEPEALETDTNAWAGRGRGGPIADSPDTRLDHVTLRTESVGTTPDYSDLSPH